MSQTTVIELPEGMRTPMHREVNKGLMVMWINANLPARATYDVRSSLALYDADGDFALAMPAAVAKLDNFAEILQKLFEQTRARFYTIGIR